MTNKSPFLVKNPYTKAFDFSPWGGIEGFLEASKAGATGWANKGSQYRIVVPDIFRATDMTAVAISSLPFCIMNGEEVVDDSAEWENTAGGMPNPQRLIYNIASSLCSGAAYVIPQGTKDVTVGLQYVPPSTISYTTDVTGIREFIYTSQFGETNTFLPDELIHFFLPDSDVQDQPAKAHPLGVAMSAALRSWAMNQTINVQSERGFIAPTLLMAEGMPIKEERDKTEAWWNLWLKGAFNQVAKVINAKTLSVQKVGAGMDELKTVFVELKRDASEEVYKSFGIPAAMAMSEKAYATEYDALIRQWYSNSIFVTIYQTIAETFTEQYYSKQGLTMRFKPETLDVFQDDENQRANAFKVYVDAGIKRSIAAEMLGIELPSGVDYDDLDEQPEPPENTDNGTNPTDMNSGNMMDEGKPPEQPTQPKEPMPMRAIVLSPDEMKDVALWYDKSVAWHPKGKSAVDWENKHLREEIAAPIRLKLASAKNLDDIRAAFVIENNVTETPAPVYDDGAIKALADAINGASEKNVQPVQVVVNPPKPETKRVSFADIFAKDGE